jgi:excisionase family DNA binding protein
MTKELLYSTEAVADILGVSPSTLARWRRTGEPDLPYVRVGSRIRYRASDLAEFLEEIDDEDGKSDADDEDSDEEDESDT